MAVVAPPSQQSPPTRRGTKRARKRARKKYGLKPVRRWPRRAIIALGSLIVVIALVVAGALFYVHYRLDQVKTAKCDACVAAAPGQPFTVLLIGSDSRAFVDDQSEQDQFGSSTDAGGQRSDVTIVARIVPATHQVLLMSIPRDLWVDIPGNVKDVSGPNRINSAFNNGPSLLAETVRDDLGITVNDFAEVNFPGFQRMVDSLGGIYLNFPDPVKDKYSGLDITRTGCQLVGGAQALALVRSRHLYYYADGTWNADVQSDFSRIQRQDVFFRAVIARSHQRITDPLAINSFIGALVADITVNSSFKGQLLGLAEAFHGVGGSNLKTETLPVTEGTNQYGEDVLFAAQPYARSMIAQFNAFGANTSKKTSSASSKIAPSSFHVTVLNGNGTSGAAATAASELAKAGYEVTHTANASSFSYTTSQIQYAPGHETAARQFAASISGGTTLVSDPSLTKDDVVLTIGSTFAGVAGGSSGTATTATTAPPPSNVVTNTQTEPWNPVVCSG